MVDRFSASRFWDQAKAAGSTHIHHLGGILQLLLKQPSSPLDRTHGVRIAWGGGCPRDIWEAFQDRFGVQIRECYGMTEASSITTYNDNGVVGAVGKPVPWFDVRLLNAEGRDVPQGERGEIVVTTSLPGAIFTGYFNNPEATAKALRNSALYTGDYGSFDSNGTMYFHGRMTDSVRCRGENVSAWEVEHVAADHPDIEDCAMVGVASDIGEQDIKLFVKRKPGHALEAPALSAWLAARLASYQNPRYLAFVDDFERTASQRIMKHKLSKALDDCWDRLAKV
jgi:crotonobetaine/carnitine-CoA ligase